jgi:hypothetical protein
MMDNVSMATCGLVVMVEMVIVVVGSGGCGSGV